MISRVSDASVGRQFSAQQAPRLSQALKKKKKTAQVYELQGL